MAVGKLKVYSAFLTLKDEHAILPSKVSMTLWCALPWNQGVQKVSILDDGIENIEETSYHLKCKPSWPRKLVHVGDLFLLVLFEIILN